MNPNALIEGAGAVKGRLRIFTCYMDFPAGVRAKRLADQIISMAGADPDTSIEMWKMDSVPEIGPLMAIIAQEAAQADVLIIAASSPASPDPVLQRWLYSLAVRNDRTPADRLLIALLGCENVWRDEADQTVVALGDFARRNGMEFVWRTMEPHFRNEFGLLPVQLERFLHRNATQSTHPLVYFVSTVGTQTCRPRTNASARPAARISESPARSTPRL